MFETHWEVFCQDLSIIRSNYAPGVLPKPSVIRCIMSPMLRKWISEGSLAACRDSAPYALEFLIKKQKLELKMCEQGKVKLWVALLNLAGRGYAKIDTDYKFDPPKTFPLTAVSFAKFRDQKVAYFGGEFFSRGELISVLANDLGGTHFSRKDLKPKRAKALELLNKWHVCQQDDGSLCTLSHKELKDAQNDFAPDSTYTLAHAVTLDSAGSLLDAFDEFERIGNLANLLETENSRQHLDNDRTGPFPIGKKIVFR